MQLRTFKEKRYFLPKITDTCLEGHRDGATFPTAAFVPFMAGIPSSSFPGLSCQSKRSRGEVWRDIDQREHGNVVYDLRETLSRPPRYLFVGLLEISSLEIQFFELRIDL